jgi:serine/threonine protein kinase
MNETAGINVPELAETVRSPTDALDFVIAMLVAVEPEELTDATFTETWQQVDILRGSGIAHRDLRLANVLLDDQDNPWIIDFEFSELAAADLLLQNDIAEFATSSALFVGAERSVQCAVDVLGEESVSAATLRMQGAALSGATKNALKERDDDLRGQIRAEIAIATGRDTPPLDRITRLRPAPNRRPAERTNGDAR